MYQFPSRINRWGDQWQENFEFSLYWINLQKHITQWTLPPFSYSTLKTNIALAHHQLKSSAQMMLKWNAHCPSSMIILGSVQEWRCLIRMSHNYDLIKMKSLIKRIYAVASLHYSLPTKRHRQHLVWRTNNILTYIHTKCFCSHKTCCKLAQRHPFLNSWH